MANGLFYPGMGFDQSQFGTLLELGALTPEEEELMRKQAMIEQLRQSSMEPGQVKTVGNIAVAPSWSEHLSKLGQAYMARKGFEKAGEVTKDIYGRKSDILKKAQAQHKMQMGIPLTEEEKALLGMSGGG